MEPFQFRAEQERPQLYYLRSWMERFPGLTAGMTSRLGGVSAPPYASLNMGLHVGDQPADVVRNRERAAAEIGLPLSSWVFAEQVHGTQVAYIREAERGRGAFSRTDEISASDALITTDSKVVLAALFADCVPLYFIDPAHRAIAVAHAGWQGTVGSIAEQVVDSMKSRYGSAPGGLYAAIGPSIRSCCYQVDERVAQPVRTLLAKLAAQDGCDDDPGSYLLSDSEEGKYRLDLQLVNRQIMIKAGILPSRIEITKWCTSCNVDQLFSHRKEKGTTGRMCAWIGWSR